MILKRFLSFVLIFLLLSNAWPVYGDNDWRQLNREAKELYEAGEYNKGLEKAQKALAYLERSSKPDLEAYSVVSLNLCEILAAKGSWDKAEKTINRAIDKLNGKTGDKALLDKKLHSKLAGLYLKQDRAEEAAKIWKRILKDEEKALGKDHPNLAPSMKNLAMIYVLQEDYSKAERLLKKVSKIVSQSLGADHLYTAGAANNLASVYYRQGRYKDAASQFRMALGVLEENYGSKHPHVVMALNNLGSTLIKLDQYNESESLLKRALELDTEAYGPEHPRLAVTLVNLARLYQAKDMNSKAQHMYEEALDVLEKKKDSNQRAIIKTLESMAEFYDRIGKKKEAGAVRKEIGQLLANNN